MKKNFFTAITVSILKNINFKNRTKTIKFLNSRYRHQHILSKPVPLMTYYKKKQFIERIFHVLNKLSIDSITTPHVSI